MANALTATSRVSTATVVAVATPQTQEGILEVLSRLASGGVRPVFITLGAGVEVQRRDEEGVTIIDGLLPRYLDNAVAGLRLSSLPTLAWWRADELQVLDDLSSLVDRIVLDVEDPSAAWALVPVLATHTSLGDMRWAALTRWRDLIAQFFDIPEVLVAVETFDRVELRGLDRHAMRLLGGWLASRLPSKNRLTVAIEQGETASIDEARVLGADGALSVRLLAGRSCLETSVQMGSGHSSRRVVAAGDDRPMALLTEELRVRSRDLAFEDAVRAGALLNAEG